MDPTRILPDLQCSVLCEDVRQEANGNFILIGVINAIVVPGLPVTAGRVIFFNRWTAGLGRFRETLRLVAPDQATVLSKREVNFELPHPNGHAINIAVLPNVTFHVPGTYFVEVLVDDVMKIRYPVNLVVLPPQGQPAPGTPPPAET
ncbi:hypothetical protein NXS98_15125 [Fontisphaera persica]|jgi:hypothetical protein|uniref:DUF6941 family protein n=1 Tax=Fontisphaera persica TaxID=2974023 RepID=UPI0024C04671|nr:hypothetical protein [Fontisphaera persica]WCJ59033.1 hypothetical protein NXS98_15125 [Fontisphaera persica]